MLPVERVLAVGRQAGRHVRGLENNNDGSLKIRIVTDTAGQRKV